jgi:acetyl-CoA C-acetyltransferase/acetyl-CoA acyltransferase
VPEEVPAVTVHRNCASGLEAVTYACDKASAGKGDIFLVGGVESMSQAPFLFSYTAVKKFSQLSRSKSLTQKMSALAKFRPSDFSPQVSLKLGMVDSLCDMNMGQTAELLARDFGITRRDQDEFAESSHLKALAARACGRFDSELAPFYLTNDDCIRSSSGKVVTEDNGPRNDSFVDKLGKLRPVFDREGTVTAGNSSQVTDGGVAMLIMTEAGLRKTGCTPLARIVDYAYVGCEPKRMGLGPVNAISKVCHTSGLNVSDADLIEVNEAFAAQVIAVLKQAKKLIYEIPREILNVNGGAIALGHPLAASGARLALTMAKELVYRDAKRGLVSLCVGGGQGGALWIERA